VTGKTSHGGRREGAVISLGSEGPGISTSFGPQSFTTAKDRLFDERVDASQIRARPRSFWGGVLGKLAKKAAEAVINTATRYNRPGYARAAARSGPYPVTHDGIEIDPGKVGIYRAVLTGKYPVEDADQSFLQRITGKFGRYVYGANWAGRLFVDRGLKRKSPEQCYATYFHEAGHTAQPELDEEGIEAVSKAYALHLARNDPSETVRERAWKAYTGFQLAEHSAGPDGVIPFPSRRQYLAAAA